MDGAAHSHGAAVSAGEPGSADARSLAQHAPSRRPSSSSSSATRIFHRVDENGLQLPYIDQFVLNVSSSAIIPAKTGAGESDLQVTASTSPTTLS